MNLLRIKDQNLKELIKGSSAALILKVAGMLFTYLSMLFITRYYGAEAWGLYTLGFTVLSMSVVISAFGFDNALIRLITELNEKHQGQGVSTVLIKALGITLVVSAIVIFALDYFSEFIVYKLLREEGFILYLGLVQIAVIPMVLLLLISVVFQSYKQIFKFMLIKSALLSFIFLLFLCVNHFLEIGAEIFEVYIYAIVAVLLVGIVLLTLFFKSKTLQPIKSKSKFVSLKYIINLSFPMMLSSSFALLMNWTDILMLSYFKTSEDVGIYNSAFKLAAITLIALTAVNSISTPKFAEFFSQNDILGLKNVVQKSTKLMFMTSAPILLVFMVFPKTILSIFGAEFVSGYIVLILLCAARFVNSVSGSVGYLMQMTNNQKVYQYIIILAFILNLILNYILIPIYGINGAAFSSAVAMAFWNLALVLIIKQKLGFWTIYIPFIPR